jgi:hyperosmotically inducible periplasmic protein
MFYLTKKCPPTSEAAYVARPLSRTRSRIDEFVQPEFGYWAAPSGTSWKMQSKGESIMNARGFLLSFIAAASTLGIGIGSVTLAQDAAPKPHSDSVGAALSDTAITAKVKGAFVGDDRLKGSHIKVVTTNRVVTLTGTTPTDDSRTAAEELARNTDGVRGVDDQLRAATDGSTHRVVAKTERIGSDSWITTKVKSEILGDSVSKGFDVHVKTIHGVVELSGTLRNEDAIAHVKDLAERIEGVKSVDISGLRAREGG